MKSLAMFLAVAIGAVAAIAATEDVNASKITVTGEVVRYEAGKTLIVRGIDGHEVTYAIAPTLAAPADVAVGRRVTVVTEPSPGGAVFATKITTEAGPDGAGSTTAEKTIMSPPEAQTRSQITTVSGTVSVYEPGRLITILRPNATTVTYTIDANSTVPSSLAKGRRVVVRTISRPGMERPLVRKVTYSKTTKRTTTVR